MKRGEQSGWFHGLAVFTALATFCLIGIGGLVTSHEAGMAVPDWPTSYGYNMFFFPIRYWQGGIFYEHTHRLFAAFVGLLTTLLAGWALCRESRRSVRWLAVSAFFTVLLQGVLGGLRVTLSEAQLGIAHGALAQIFLILTASLALATSPVSKRFAQRHAGSVGRGFRWLALGCVTLVFAQLLLGATMRHQHAGLAVPDFPLAYGRWWPRTDPAFIQQINQERIDTQGYNPITAWQIQLHMAHRIGALAILLAVAALAAAAWKKNGAPHWLTRAAAAWLGLVLLQALLGAATVWSNKAADIATLHVMGGALNLTYGAMICLAAWRLARTAQICRRAKLAAAGPAPAPLFPAQAK